MMKTPAQLIASICFLAIIASPAEARHFRLPGMGLREGVRNWNAYVIESNGALLKINHQLEVVASHQPVAVRDPALQDIDCAAMACGEECIYIGATEWPTGCFGRIRTGDLIYTQGPVADFPKFDIEWPIHSIQMIAPVSERFVYVRNDMYGSHPSGEFFRVDTHRNTADFLPDPRARLDASAKDFRVSPDGKQFVVLDRKNVARLFRTEDGRVLKESHLPPLQTPISCDVVFPDHVYVYGYDVDWDSEHLDVWWTRLTAERPLQRVLIALGENKIRVVESIDENPWPASQFCMTPFHVDDASEKKAYPLLFHYLSFGDIVGYPSPCLTSDEARFFAELINNPGRFSSVPSDICGSFVSPDGRCFFCATLRTVPGYEQEYGLCVIDVETGRIVATWEQTGQIVGVFFDSGIHPPSKTAGASD